MLISASMFFISTRALVPELFVCLSGHKFDEEEARRRLGCFLFYFGNVGKWY